MAAVEHKIQGESILSVQGLVVEFRGEDKTVRAVNDLSFDLSRNETLGIVGESGCGKSLTSLSIMRLVPRPNGVIPRGRIVFGGRDLLTIPEKEMRGVRGNDIAMIFQEPLTALNPVLTIGRQLVEPLMVHRAHSRATARQEALRMLDVVRISEPERRFDQYPHELSGGMRQRVMIAIALICKPAVLIADEPTTALDVTIQAEILSLMTDLQRDMGLSILLITHDLGVIAKVAKRVIVMYAGRKVEEATVEDLYNRPLHPYSQGLIRAVPKLGSSLRGSQGERLMEIPGVVPEQTPQSVGCAFAPRCSKAQDRCFKVAPEFLEHLPSHSAACHEISA